jgi:hypothetical protein
MGARIVLTDGTGRWFDRGKAQRWKENTRWNGNNHVSCATGSQWEHETLYRTAGGVYVLHRTSQWQGSGESWDEVTASDAAGWLSRNDHARNDHDADDADDASAAGVANEFAALEIV